MNTEIIHPMVLPDGTVVTVEVQVGPISVIHWGLKSGQIGSDGLPTVLNASKRRGYHLEETWTDFTGGQLATIRPTPANVTVPEMLRRARADIGRPWDLWSANCEHAIARWRGLPEKSPQLRGGVLGITALVGLAIVLRR